MRNVDLTLDQYIATLDSENFRLVQNYMLNATDKPIGHEFTPVELERAIGAHYIGKAVRMWRKSLK